MEISKASVTAIHGLVYLANTENDEPVDVQEIAQSLGLPQGYLAKIFQQLSRSRLLNSHRGPHGGYVLATEAEEISLMDIIEAIEGPVVTDRCELGRGGTCRLFDRCEIRKKLDRVKRESRDLYRSITLDMFDRQFKGF